MCIVRLCIPGHVNNHGKQSRVHKMHYHVCKLFILQTISWLIIILAQSPGGWIINSNERRTTDCKCIFSNWTILVANCKFKWAFRSKRFLCINWWSFYLTLLIEQSFRFNSLLDICKSQACSFLIGQQKVFQIKKFNNRDQKQTKKCKFV